MKEASLPGDNAAWDKAIKFLQRTQNNSETNDQTWAANDGGFIYYPGYSQAGETRSYGSATYAGIMSYIWANVKKTDDPRVQAVLKWVRDNYTVDENPGIGQKTVYYYYMVFAKALQAVGEPVIVDAKGAAPQLARGARPEDARPAAPRRLLGQRGERRVAGQQGPGDRLHDGDHRVHPQALEWVMISPVRRRRFPRAVAAAACLMAGTTAAVAADDRVTLVAHAGLDTRARAGRWTPVLVTIENSGTDITGDLVVDAGQVRVVRALALPAPSRKRIEQYVRVPSADLDRIHVALVVAGREMRAVDAPIRVIPDEKSFVLCVGPVGTNQPEPSCTATVDRATLPVSWRGYDALDDLRWPAGEKPRLDEDQTAAIGQWKIRRAHELVIAPAAESLEPPRALAQVRSLIAVYAGLFLLVTACAQALGRSPCSSTARSPHSSVQVRPRRWRRDESGTAPRSL